MAAVDDLNELLQGLPGEDLITPAMKDRALAGALIPDSSGVWPGGEGYVPTYDVYFAAYSLIGFLRAQPTVTNANSEGTGVTVTPPDWAALMRYYTGQSPILSGHDVLQVVPIPDPPYIHRTDMRGRDAYYGDVDTDLG